MMKNFFFARCARAFFIFEHLTDLLVLSTTWNEQFCSWMDDVNNWWQMFNFVFLPLKRWSVSIYCRTVRTHLARVLNNGSTTDKKKYVVLYISFSCKQNKNKKEKAHNISALACVGRVSVRFRNKEGRTRVKDGVKNGASKRARRCGEER